MMDAYDRKIYSEYVNEHEYMKGMRLDTVMQICMAVGCIENMYLDDEEEEAVTLEEAIDMVYTQFIDDCSMYIGNTKAAMFSGKQKIMNAIKEEILISDIRIKNS